MWSFCIQSTFCYYGSHLGSHFHCTISTHYRFITWIRLPFYPLFFFSLVLILCNVYLIKTLTTKYIANIFIIVYFCWIPRNIGIHGNSQAEKAAQNLLQYDIAANIHLLTETLSLYMLPMDIH